MDSSRFNSPKKLVTDVVGENRGSARSDLLDSESTRPQFLSRKRREELPELNTLETRRSRKKMFFSLGGIILVVVLFFVFSAVFSAATIEVVPREEIVSVDSQFSFYRETEEATPYFKIVSAEKEVRKELSATGKKFVERKASGTIIVFNGYDTKPLTLIKNTRFEAPNGNIYRIQNAIVVPGGKNQGGRLVPGSLEVTVYADVPGEKYNIGLVDFTIPGLKGDPRASSVYARSKTPMTGGFAGEVNVVSDSERLAVEAELASLLEKELSSAVSEITPDGYVLLPETKIETRRAEEVFSPPTGRADGIERDSGNAVFVARGRVLGVVISERDVAHLIAGETISDYLGEDIYLGPTSELRYEILENFDFDSTLDLEVGVAGTAVISFTFDELALKNILAGKKKSAYKEIFEEFPTIERAEIVIRPPWRRSFPDNPEKIRVLKTDSLGVN